MIDKERITRQFVKLVSIDAPSYREREMADYLTKELEENENGFFLKKHLKYFGTLSDRADRLMSRTVHLLEYAQQVKEAYQAPVSYTHLTLPTT